MDGFDVIDHRGSLPESLARSQSSNAVSAARVTRSLSQLDRGKNVRRFMGGLR